MKDRVYSITQAAELCRINRITMWRWIKAGKLTAYQLPSGRYRIMSKDLNQFIRKHLAFVNLDNTREPIKILVVDDDASFRKLIKRILSEDDYTVEEADNGFDAGLKILLSMPTIVILDLFMPNIDGFEICNRVKSESQTKGIKILAVTDKGSPEIEEKIIQSGADAYLKKPIMNQDLMECMERLK